MIFPFQEEVINDKDYSKYNFEHPQFIGYLNKYGEILDYSNPLGLGGHDNNKMTSYFEHYFRMPENDSYIQQFEGRNAINIENEEWYAQNRKDYFKQKMKKIAYSTKKYGKNQDAYNQFINDLDLFFYNCYQANTFMDGFGQNCMVLNQSEFYQQFCKGKKSDQRKSDETEEQYREKQKHFFEYDYHWYRKKLMLDWYKTVIVQYMHYHLIERCKKGITTCDLRPNETFYNYLINGFTIHQIPRMIYDDTNKFYVAYKQNEFLISDRELRLQEEIQAIKKLVPLEERSKYYR